MEFKAKNTQVTIVDGPESMGIRTAEHIANSMLKNAENGKKNLLWLMAAPSAFPFYKAFINKVENEEKLREVVKETEFFQFDDYPVSKDSEKYPITFRHLLETHFHAPLRQILGELRVNALDLTEDDEANEKISLAYLEKIIDLKSNGANLIQLKGIGMDGHWGFHGAETPLDIPAAIIKVPMNEQNIQQQMLDWPEYFRNPSEVPSYAYTFNVQAFLLADEIIDNVPQASKAYSVLATYGTDEVTQAIPSSALKNHENSFAFLTKEAASSLIEYKKDGKISWTTVESLKKLWRNENNEEIEKKNQNEMLNTLAKLGLLT